MSRRAAVSVALALTAGVACSSPKPTPAWHQETGYRWREVDVPTGGTPGFTKMDAGKTGIRFQNSVSDSVLLGNRVLGQGAGTCLGDVDGDGRFSLCLLNTSPSTRDTER
jgi:hypothetical protein